MPPSDMTVVNGHVVIETTGQETYTVDGELWNLDESDLSPATGPALPTLVALGNHPNPFNPITTIAFEVRIAGPARVEVFDLTGRRLWSRSVTTFEGINATRWDGRDQDGGSLPAGIYPYRLTAGDGHATGTMVLVK